MILSAVCHFPDKRYCYSVGKNKLLIRIKTAKDDISSLILHAQEKYLPISFIDTRESKKMKKIASDEVSDYYEAEIEKEVVCLRYYFELVDNEGNVFYYGNYSFSKEEFEDVEDMFDCPQNLREEERFEIPSWFKNKIVYQIFPTRFATSKDVSKELWYKNPIGRDDNLHGDLRGIIDHLDHIKELGVDIIYTTPIFKANTIHKYDTVDYYEIDPDIGTKEDLKELVDKAHSLGMRVVLDGVFNHTSPDFFAFKDVKENGENSKYKDWYYVQDYPVHWKWGERANYKTFAWFGGMPKLNLSNKETADYIIGVVRYWTENFHIDGWRLDVGDEMVHDFFKRLRKELRSINNEILITGEAWHLTADYLEGDEWDTIMNYDFKKATLGFAAREFSPSRTLSYIGFMKGTVHKDVYPVLWNLIDSHDTERALYTCHEDKRRFRLAVSMQLLSTGMPMIYYGDEYAMTGKKDPDCRRGMFWDEEYQDKDMFEFYKTLIRIRKEHPVITEGDTTDLKTNDESGWFKITKELGEERITLIFSNNDKPVDCEYAYGTDLITGNEIEGILKPYQCVVLR